MNLISVLVTGLFAGGVSCAAVQGGLLAGLLTRMRSRELSGTREGVSVVSKSDAARPRGTDLNHRSPLSSLTEDLVPVGGFLAGKLVSHSLLGLLLGALGGAVQLSVGTRTSVQIVAGLLIVAFGLAQLGVPWFRNLVIEPPRSWMRFVRDRARSQSALAPAMLGFASVLLPCGVTLSVQALALASGSPWAGAAIMAVFVAGTAPLFALLGYAARRAATAWRGRLAIATGLVVLAMGFYTLNGGLELAGSPMAATRVIQALSSSETAGPAATAASAVTRNATGQQVVIVAESDSYSPEDVRVAAGVPTTLIVRSDNARGCIRSFVIPDRDIETILPVRGDTRIELGTLPPGPLRYSCGMGMYTGVITAG